MPGLGVALVTLAPEPKRVIQPSGPRKPSKSNRVLIAGALLIAVAAVPLVSNVRQSLLASWLANFGAVEMSKVGLAKWPTGAWDDGSHVSELAAL